MEKQGSLKTEAGLVKWDLPRGYLSWDDKDICVEGSYQVVVGKTATILNTKIILSQYDRKADKWINHQLTFPFWVGEYFMRFQRLGPGVAQIPYFGNGDESFKMTTETRKERLDAMIKFNPDVENWFVYLTNQQRWHKFAMNYGFKKTDTFVNPNTSNKITEYYLAV